MPRINLLPWREAERKRKRQEFFLSIGAAVATAALVTLVGRWQMSAAIDHQNERNRIITDEIAELDKQIQEILGLEKQKQALRAVYPSLVELVEGVREALKLKKPLVSIPRLLTGSFAIPVVVMLAIPFGIVGAVLGHLLMGYSLSLMSMMGKSHD